MLMCNITKRTCIYWINYRHARDPSSWTPPPTIRTCTYFNDHILLHDIE